MVNKLAKKLKDQLLKNLLNLVRIFKKAREKLDKLLVKNFQNLDKNKKIKLQNRKNTIVSL